MKTKIYLFIFILSVLFTGLFLFLTKKKFADVGKQDINKTLNSIEKLEDMKSNSAYDSQLVGLLEGTENVLLSSFKGKLVLLNFWASWCEPCIKEFPDMIKLAEEVPDLAIIAVNRDFKKEDAIKFINAFPESKAKIKFYWDKEGTVTQLYGTEVLPESFIINKDFKVIRKITGIEDWDHPRVIEFFKQL